MSWEVHKVTIQSSEHPSDFPPIAEKAKSEVKSLQTAVTELRARLTKEKNSRDVHEAFEGLRIQARECARAVQALGQTHAYTPSDREARARTINLLSASLETELRRIESLAYDLSEEDRTDLLSTSAGQVEAQDFEDALLQDRREELARVEACMGDIQALIADTAKLVRTQGDTLDRIDVNMDKAANNTANAAEELKKTERRQKTKRALLCLMIFSLMIGIVVVVTVVTVEK
jgi:DNA repair exonuclease SbcCD ATPase subunit